MTEFRDKAFQYLDEAGRKGEDTRDSMQHALVSAIVFALADVARAVRSKD